MLDFSADDIFDIGSMTACDKLGYDVAHYTILELYLNTVPSFIKMGFCIPSACSQSALTIITEKISPYLQDWCLEKFSIATLNDKQTDPKNHPKCHFALAFQNKIIEEKRRKSYPYMVTFLSIYSAYLVFVICMSFRDYFKFTTDETILHKKVQMK